MNYVLRLAIWGCACMTVVVAQAPSSTQTAVSISPTVVQQGAPATATAQTKSPYMQGGFYVSGGQLTVRQHPSKSCDQPHTPGGDFSGLGPALGSEDPTDGQFGVPVDTTALGKYAVHAIYQGQGSGYRNSSSPCVDFTVIPAEGQACPANGLVISATLAAGNGFPTSGCSASWTYRITVNNCSASTISKVTAQGGTTGWATYGNSAADKGTAGIRKSNNKTEVIFWDIGSLAAGESANLDVTQSGKASKPNGTVMYLSGSWSALNYDLVDPITLVSPSKSDYTGRVSITTNSVANGGSCLQ
jgi:hypothetical protein